MDTCTKCGGWFVDQGDLLLILVGGILNMMVMPIANQKEEDGCHKCIESLGT